MALPIALYGRVSKKEQAHDSEALPRQLWQLNRAASDFQGEAVEYVDIQSGRRDDRPEFQKLLGLIQSKSVSMVVLTRIDRITRDLETNAKLAKLFEGSQVKIHEILLGRTIDWANPNDWEYFVRSGVKAESESRMLSARIKQTLEWHRVQGKAVGAVGFGYRRSPQNQIEPNPEQWETAIAMVRIYIEENGGRTAAVERIRNELGLERTMNGLSNWIKSPLIRGHTRYGTMLPDGRRKPNGPQVTIIENTHRSLFAEPELQAINAQAEVERILRERKYKRGKIGPMTIRPLSGIVFCKRCGMVCHLKTSQWSKKPQKYHHFACSGHTQKQTRCGANANGPVYVKYEVVEAAVVEALRRRGETLAPLVIADFEEAEAQETTEMVELRAQIARLSAMGDPDLQGAIDIKSKALNKLLADLHGGDDSQLREAREQLVQYASVPAFWGMLTMEERKALYREYVGKVLVDGNDIEVSLLI